MAVAVTRMADELRRFQRKQKVQLTKYFGKCLMPDGSVSVLVAKATDAREACEKLHKGYRIDLVMELMTEEEMPKEWAKIKPSLIQRGWLY